MNATAAAPRPTIAASNAATRFCDREVISPDPKADSPGPRGINGSNMGLTETFAFYFAKNSSGSVISGFNILTNSDYGIIAQNAKNITISSNNISGGYKCSIKLNNISNVTVSKNGLFNSKGNGINIENSKKITVNENQISNNTYSGIHVYNSESINVKKIMSQIIL